MGKIGNTQVKVRVYPLVSDAVEEGLAYGIARVWEHLGRKRLSQQEMEDQIDTLHTAVMNGLCELLDFDPLAEDGDQERVQDEDQH